MSAGGEGDVAGVLQKHFAMSCSDIHVGRAATLLVLLAACSAPVSAPANDARENDAAPAPDVTSVVSVPGACQDALTLRPGESVIVAPQRGGTTCTEGQPPGQSNYFALTIPPRSLAHFYTDGSGYRYPARFYHFDSCSDTRCRVASMAGPIEPIQRAAISNDSAAPRDAVLALEVYESSLPAAFKLAIHPLASAVCESPTPLSVGAPAQTGEFSRGGVRPAPCLALALYYAVTVPAASVGRIELSGAGGAYAARWIESCTSFSCELPPRDNPPVMLATNSTSAPNVYLLEVLGPANGSVRIAHVANAPR